jgi:glycosyltransferase involved in cell wall biosynthesis
MISGVIISYNEEHNIERCIRSMHGLVDEVLLVDSYSTDNTVKLALALGARVIKQKFLGYVAQKDFAMRNAKYDWVLSLDADEAISEELKQSLNKIDVLSAHFSGYIMNRRNWYCERWIKYAGWYPDRKLRLWDKRNGKWGGVDPHDKVFLDHGKQSIRLNGDILHYTCMSVKDHLEQTKKFAKVSSLAMHKSGLNASYLNVILSPLVRFTRDYIIKLGILEGYLGLILCVINAYGVYLKYNMLKSISHTTVQ